MNARLSDVAGVRAVELELGFNRVEEYADASGASISYIETGTGLKAKSFALAGASKSVSAYVWQLAPGLVCVRVVDLHGAIIKRVLANVTGPQLYPQFIVGMVARPRWCLRYFLGGVCRRCHRVSLGGELGERPGAWRCRGGLPRGGESLARAAFAGRGDAERTDLRSHPYREGGGGGGGAQ